MKQILGLVAALGVTVLASRSYLNEPKPPAHPPAPPKLTAEPLADLVVANPTGVLLGEAPAPPEALRGAVTPAPNLIVPEIRKE